MFIRRALAVSLSLLFVLSLFFPLKAVMAASTAAPVPAPPAVVPPAIGADSGKQPSDDNKQPSTPPAVVPPAVPSADNKQSGASPSPVAPKVEAGLSQEPKQAVSPEAEEKAGKPQSNKVASPVANEEKKNNSNAAKVPGKVKAAGAELGADADLPPWREKLVYEDLEKMAGCEAIADHEHKQIIIRPKNGAKEGVISSLPKPYSSGLNDYTYKFGEKFLNDSMAMLEVISSTESYTLKFEKRIYFWGMLTPALGVEFKFNFLNCNPCHSGCVYEIPVMADEEIPEYKMPPRDSEHYYKVKLGGSTLASLGNIADVNAKFLSDLSSFLPNSKNIKDINALAKLKCSRKLSMRDAFTYMKALTGYADFSKFQAGTDEYILDMCSAFKGAGTDDFVLNFSNKKLYKLDHISDGRQSLSSSYLEAAFKDFKGVLIANNWEHEKTCERVNSKTGKKIIKTVNSFLFNPHNSEFRSPHQLFGVSKKDAEKGYSLSSLVVTDNPELLKIKKNSKYYKKITISYLDQKEELELPAIYDSRITATGACDQNQPASADYMKIVKYQVDEAIRAKVAEIKRKCGLPDNFPLEAVPTKEISSTPTSLFQEYRLPIKINELMVSPQKQVVCENAAIEKININFIYADNKKLQRFHLDTAALEQQLPQGLKLLAAGNNLLNSAWLHFFPLAVGFNGSPLLQVLTQPVATISGTIQCDDSKVTKKKVDGKEEYYVYLTISGTAEYADGRSGVLTQKAEIQVLPNIPVGNKPETSSTLSAYLILAGALSVILTGRNLAKK
ncbi:hypothetical protein PYS61_00675 [Amygdalobacter indicium]|uniref:Uncharacterized protein n=1 Tax=Amygdalobacter indicium TaxID=3029272 RepID=A0ABY8C852_9FIRM|nr:hypothetical protein [Amygdalobacter indicium]WEG35709.1 hypothetical protein PYS61_00675 [Amygdalobacter indicium]